MKWLSGALLVVSCVFAVSAAQDNAAKKDLDAMQGDWQAVAVEVDGNKLPDEEVKSARLTFKGDKVITTDKGARTHEATVKLDPTKKPKTIDILPATGADAGKTQLGIYSIEGDKLIICGGKGSEGARPTELKSGQDVVYIVLQRIKPAK